jgi:hypothetical protein
MNINEHTKTGKMRHGFHTYLDVKNDISCQISQGNFAPRWRPARSLANVKQAAEGHMRQFRCWWIGEFLDGLCQYVDE